MRGEQDPKNYYVLFLKWTLRFGTNYNTSLVQSRKVLEIMLFWDKNEQDDFIKK